MATICRVCRCDWLDIFIDWKQREEEKNVERERKVASARGLHDACDACDAGDASTRVPTNVLLFVCFMDLSLSAPVFLFFIFLSTPPLHFRFFGFPGFFGFFRFPQSLCPFGGRWWRPSARCWGCSGC